MLVYEQNDRFRTNIPTEQISCIFFSENVGIKEYLPRREGRRKGLVDNLGTPEGSKPLRWQEGVEILRSA